MSRLRFAWSWLDLREIADFRGVEPSRKLVGSVGTSVDGCRIGGGGTKVGTETSRGGRSLKQQTRRAAFSMRAIVFS